MNNHSKGFVVPLLIALVGVVLAVGGYYLASVSVAPAPQKPSADAQPTPITAPTPSSTTIEPAPASGSAKSCVRGGCSGQLCVEERVGGDGFATTCDYRAEYACYHKATCERQPSGSCGWTQTADLSACLANPPRLNSEASYEIYTVFPGYTSQEGFAEFNRTKKTCVGRSEPIPGDPRLADGPSLAKCYGYLE